MSIAPSIATGTEGDAKRLAAAGSWTAAHANQLEKLIDDTARETTGQPSILIDMAEVSEFDTYGACLLNRLQHERTLRNEETQVTSLPSDFTGLLTEIQEIPPIAKAPEPPAFSLKSKF